MLISELYPKLVMENTNLKEVLSSIAVLSYLKRKVAIEKIEKDLIYLETQTLQKDFNLKVAISWRPKSEEIKEVYSENFKELLDFMEQFIDCFIKQVFSVMKQKIFITRRTSFPIEIENQTLKNFFGQDWYLAKKDVEHLFTSWLFSIGITFPIEIYRYNGWTLYKVYPFKEHL